MTLISSTIGASRRHALGIGQVVRDWYADDRQRRRMHREMRDLARLPDHLLRDMGREEFISRRRSEFHAYWR